VSSPLVLRLAGPEAADGYVDEFVAAVDQLSSGSIKIELVENTRDPEINIEQQYIEDAKANRFDLVQVAARAWDVAGVNVFRPFVAPFLITNYDLEQAVIASPTADTALAALAPVGLVGIALVPGGMRHPVGSTKPILALADLAGAHVAIVPSGVAQQTFQAFGATAEGFLIGNPLTGYDAIEQDLDSLAYDAYDTTTTAMTTNVNLWPRMVTVVMNDSTYATLTADQQRILHDAGQAANPARIDTIRKAQELDVTHVCGNGYHLVTATDADLAAFKTAAQPVISSLAADPAEASAIAAIQALAASHQGITSDTPTCPDASTTGPSS
jgi:TRAP-type C4-dicarboxylate transport system substrate-binding protein